MQPTFLPWAGYFNLMAQVDDFVLLDDVQLEKQSWQTRNRLVIGGEVRWVVVPVRNTSLAQTIRDTEVLHGTHWREKLARGFAINYGRHPHFAEAEEIIQLLLASSTTLLADMNETVIRFVARRLGLAPQLHRASRLPVEGARSARLVALCRHFQADEYLSPVGSAEYLAQDEFTQHVPSRLRFQAYAPAAYAQKGSKEFHSHLSIVDVVANLGWQRAGGYVRDACLPAPDPVQTQLERNLR
jgi:hypothetical protein